MNPSTKGGCVAPNRTLLLPDFANDVNGNVIDKGFPGGDCNCNGSPVYTYLSYLNIKARQANYSNHADKGERLFVARPSENKRKYIMSRSTPKPTWITFICVFQFSLCSSILLHSLTRRYRRKRNPYSAWLIMALCFHLLRISVDSLAQYELPLSKIRQDLRS